jgi:hypothetical protein
MIGGNREKVRLCEVTASFTPYYGMDGCAYEPITPDTGKGEGYDYDTI